MIKPKWNSEAVKAYETGQGVELVNETYPHYVPKNPIKGTKMYKPRLDQGVDYERGFIDGMQKQMQSSVDKAVNAMSQRTCEGCGKVAKP